MRFQFAPRILTLVPLAAVIGGCNMVLGNEESLVAPRDGSGAGGAISGGGAAGNAADASRAGGSGGSNDSAGGNAGRDGAAGSSGGRGSAGGGGADAGDADADGGGTGGRAGAAGAGAADGGGAGGRAGAGGAGGMEDGGGTGGHAGAAGAGYADATRPDTRDDGTGGAGAGAGGGGSSGAAGTDAGGTGGVSGIDGAPITTSYGLTNGPEEVGVPGNILFFLPIQISTGGTLVALGAFVKPQLVGQHMILGLYSVVTDTGGMAPGKLIQASPRITVLSGVNEAGVTATPIAAGTYMLAEVTDGTTYFAASSTLTTFRYANYTFGTLPVAWDGALSAISDKTTAVYAVVSH
jgi:hypothetical protein